MVKDSDSGLLIPFDFEHLIAQIPEIRNFNFKIDNVPFGEPIDSSNMKPENWSTLAQLIRDNYDQYDGFVVLHGSDTMAYTASALSFMLQNLGKPVILTGSQLPIGVIRTDGKENLITAIEIAAAKNENNEPVVPEVAIYFEYHLYRGNRTTKVSASHFEAFSTPNYPTLAEAGIDINYNFDAIVKPAKGSPQVQLTLEAEIGSIKFFPGIQPAFIEPLMLSEKLKVIVLETYGSGNIPTLPWFEELVSTAIASGKNVVNVTQCLRGTVNQGSYETSSFLQSIGVVSGRDITFEAAITKSMFLLGAGTRDFKSDFTKNICGEIS